MKNSINFNEQSIYNQGWLKAISPSGVFIFTALPSGVPAGLFDVSH